MITETETSEFNSDDILQLSNSLSEEMPICANQYENSTKHQITPLKSKNKSWKGENKEDVHTSCSSPVTPRSRLSKSQVPSPCGSALASAYYLDVCSQELPEVIWDYTSPKQTGGLKQKERTIAIDDLLQNMHWGSKVPSINSKSSANLQLLEKWMEVRSISPASQRVRRTSSRDFRKGVPKKPSRHLIEEMQQLFNSITGSDMASNSESSSDKISQNVKTNFVQRQLVADDCVTDKDLCNSFDSSEAIRGGKTDEDDCVIVKATQEFKSCLISSQKDIDKKSLGEMYTFKALIPPETGERYIKIHPLPKYVESNNSLLTKKDNGALSSFVKELPGELNVHEKRDQIRQKDFSCNAWDPEFDNVWGNDILEAESLSQIPDDVLLGRDISAKTVSALSENYSEKNTVNTEVINRVKAIAAQDVQFHGCNTSSAPKLNQIVNNGESCQEPDFDLFNDDLILNEHGFFAWLDKVESQSSLKCTPKEIAQKKLDALKKLRKRKGKDH